MKPRRVISSKCEDAMASSTSPSSSTTPFAAVQPAESTGSSKASSVPIVPRPASLNLFDRMQKASGSFAEWLLPPEAPVDAKPICDETAQKLKQRQAGMSHTPATTAPSVSHVDSSDSNTANNTSGALRAEASGFDGGDGYFSFGAKSLTEKEAAKSKVLLEHLQTVVSVPQSSSSYHQEHSYQHSMNPTYTTSGVERTTNWTVPLWSVERFRIAGGYCETNATVALHQEICDLVDYLSPSQAEVSLRRFVELEVTKISKRLWPGCNPCVYGSLTTHLLLPLSDIDMSILDVPVSTEEALTTLCKEIGNTPGLCSTAYPQLILKTKVPLLKFTHVGSLLDVDVSINAGDGKINSDMVKTYLSQYPEARPLVIVVKYFLQQRDMHEPYHGGLGSFATTLLVISFLQHHPIYTSRPHERPLTGLGKLLVDFFRYYGCSFNSHRCGVSLENDGFYFIRKQQSVMDSARPMTNQVIIEDPGNKSNNAASSLRQFPTIASSFAHAYAALTAVFPLVNGGSGMSPDSDEIAKRPTILSRILHVDAESVARRKCIVDTYEDYKKDPSLAQRLVEVEAFRSHEDRPMLVRAPISAAASSAAKTATTTTATNTRTMSTVNSQPSRNNFSTQKYDAPQGNDMNSLYQSRSARSSAASTPTARGPPDFVPRSQTSPPSRFASTRNTKREREETERNYYDSDGRDVRPRRVYRSPDF